MQYSTLVQAAQWRRAHPSRVRRPLIANHRLDGAPGDGGRTADRQAHGAGGATPDDLVREAVLPAMLGGRGSAGILLRCESVGSRRLAPPLTFHFLPITYWTVTSPVIPRA